MILSWSSTPFLNKNHIHIYKAVQWNLYAMEERGGFSGWRVLSCVKDISGPPGPGMVPRAPYIHVYVLSGTRTETKAMWLSGTIAQAIRI